MISFDKIIAVIILIFFTSCTPTISNFNSYQKQPLPKTAFMPSADLVEGKKIKVAIFDLETGDSNQTALQAGLGNSIAIDIENIITENRLATLVDRNVAKKLGNEIALYETNKTGSYKGPQVADYAISGNISSAGFTKKYSSGSVYVDPKTRNVISIPPKFTYTSEVAGNIKVYELPSMEVVENIEFAAKKNRSENIQSDNNLSIAGLIDFGGQRAKGIDRDDTLVRGAGKQAIELISDNIKNVFAKKGYILEKRSKDKKAIFKISVGSSDGITKGDKFEIIGHFESENSITGKIDIEKRIIATGVVTDKIDPQTAWVVIDKEDDIDSVRLGDVVKFKYKKSFLKKSVQWVSYDLLPNIAQ